MRDALDIFARRDGPEQRRENGNETVGAQFGEEKSEVVLDGGHSLASLRLQSEHDQLELLHCR